MGVKSKYQPGMIYNDYEFISRDYKDINGNWYGTFKCLKCGDVFQTRLKRIFNTTNRSHCFCLKNEKSLIGTVKGVLTVLDYAPKRENDRNTYWKCSCICGEILEISTTNFNRNKHEYCIHTQIGGGRPPSLNIGDHFGTLEVIGYLGNQRWNCKCSCGRTTIKRTDLLTSRDYPSCEICMTKSRGEQKISDILINNSINFIAQKTFDTCRFPNTNALAKFDFYLPDYNIIIEYNGSQHYTFRESGWNNKEQFENTQYRDSYKISWCKENNIRLIIIPYIDYDKLDINYLKNLINN